MARVVGAAFVLLLGHVASSARVRDVVEIREPKQADKIVPNSEQEEKHKYIHDGQEYNRPPNLFDVGVGELKLLPEVLSNLNFETRDFKDDGTTTEQKELLDSRPWGRLHIDGWPAPIQYLRSHFGGPPAEGMRRLILADPLDGCQPLRNADNAGSAVVIATRGSCTYTTKARNAQEASASALLVVNNEQGLLHPPGPDGMDLEIFSGMIPQAEGRALTEAMSGSSDPTQGILVPMNCNKNSGIGSSNQQCHAAVKGDRDVVDGLTLGGFVHLPGGEKFEYLLAEFGVKVPLGELEMGAPLNPSGACAPMAKEAATAAAGKAIVATRGACSFIEKAEAVGAGPSERVGALIVTNSETALFHMGAAPRWRGANISLPIVLVTDVAGHAISTLPPDSTIRFAPSEHVTLAAWDAIERLKEASAWPKETQERQVLYESLLARNAGFPDRVSAIRGAFSRACSWEEGEERMAARQGRGDAERRETGDAAKTTVKV